MIRNLWKDTTMHIKLNIMFLPNKATKSSFLGKEQLPVCRKAPNQPSEISCLFLGASYAYQGS